MIYMTQAHDRLRTQIRTRIRPDPVFFTAGARPSRSAVGAGNTIIESTFEVGRRFRCAMRVDCSQLDAGAVIRPVPGEWHRRIPERLDEEELADWRSGRNAVYQLAALTIRVRLAVADA